MKIDCRATIDGIYTLKKDLAFPDHLLSENPTRLGDDFDPNQYFQVLTHLQMKAGYVLDFVYYADGLGGMPLIYARPADSPPFATYTDYLQSLGEEPSGERSYSPLSHSSDYLQQVQVDQTPQSYFEFISLALLGDQFYLYWHSNYNDLIILCDSSNLQSVKDSLQAFNIPLPDEVRKGFKTIDLTPTVTIVENKVTIRFVTFSKWGGFYENIHVLDKDNPANLLDTKSESLLPYDCGIMF